MSSRPRVRFAPSPTGTLHVGGARTALFNWLFARKNKGTFILRIEDTDQERSTEASIQEILKGLQWLGLDWDEGPIKQSDRLDLYREKAQLLVDQGKAYFSDEKKGAVPAVLLKMPKEKRVFRDFLRGEVEVDLSLEKDLVLMKSDGMPTYNFACVVDDGEMKLTHIIRGDDHLSNTPKQIPLYESLGYSLPVFVHVPMILGEDGARLSKRHGATSVQAYQSEGILSEALLNFLALLGWSPGDDLEVLTKEELIRLFSLERINKKSAHFDLKKMNWMNGEYIRKTSSDLFLEKGWAFLKEKDQSLLSQEVCLSALKVIQERLQKFEDLWEQYRYFFTELSDYDPEAVEKYLKIDSASLILTEIKNCLESVDLFEADSLESEIRALALRLERKAGELIHPLRVAVTGKRVSPSIFDTLQALGKEQVLKRLNQTLKLVGKGK